MVIKDIVDETFQDYKETSMYIATSKCDWKCCVDGGFDYSVCQNSELTHKKNIEVPADEIFSRYIQNFISNAIVIGGLEPFLQFDELHELVWYFRKYSIDDDIVIYTGYNKNEIEKYVNKLSEYRNIIIKFGRYIPDQKSHFDEVLGIELASDNQYAERIS